MQALAMVLTLTHKIMQNIENQDFKRNLTEFTKGVLFLSAIMLIILIAIIY